MADSPESVLREIKAKNYSPVYFLEGEEAYYIDLITDYIETHVLTESEKGFNQTIAYGADVTMSDVLTSARRYPMMAERQVVIVKEAQQISDINQGQGQKLLIDYLKNPAATTLLVFCHKNKTLDKRKALGKEVGKYAVVVTAKKLYDNQLPGWIENYIAGRGFSITPKAVQMLADSIGNNLERLSNEIDKVLINFKDKITLDENTINKYIGISKDYNVFELQKALIDKDPVRANKIVNFFDANSRQNPVIPIIAVLYSFYSKLLIAHHTKDKSDRALASALKVNPYFVKDYSAALRRYDLNQVVRNISFIKDADLRSKGVQNVSVSDGQLLKELVFKLIH